MSCEYIFIHTSNDFGSDNNRFFNRGSVTDERSWRISGVKLLEGETFILELLVPPLLDIPSGVEVLIS